MKTKIKKAVFTGLALNCALVITCFAGQPQKWEDVPEAVRKTILAHDGKEGSTVDIESGKIDGKTIYETEIVDKNGRPGDLVVLEDGTYVEVKHDGEAEKLAELAAKSKKSSSGGIMPKFTHPRDIYNPYLPLAYLKQDVLEGIEGAKKVHIERTAKQDVRRVFKLGDQSVESFVVEDREWEDGKLAEVATDYFAQSDDGTVYYLGEDVDEYKDGKIVDHEGSWLVGKDTKKPGLFFPAHPKVGQKFKSEDVSSTIHEEDEIVAVDETVTVPTGTYHHCVKLKEHLADGGVEYKYFAAGRGVVREVPAEGGDVMTASHAAN